MGFPAPRALLVVVVTAAATLAGCTDGCRPDGFEGTWSQPGLFQVLLTSAHADFRLDEASGFGWNRSDLDAVLPGRYDATVATAITDDFFFRLDADGSLHVEAQRPGPDSKLRASLADHLRNITGRDVEATVADILGDLQDAFDDDPDRATAAASARLAGPFDFSRIQFGMVDWGDGRRTGVGQGQVDWREFAASGYPSDTWSLTISLDRFEHLDPDAVLTVDARDQVFAHVKDATTADEFRAEVAAILAKVNVTPVQDVVQQACL